MSVDSTTRFTRAFAWIFTTDGELVPLSFSLSWELVIPLCNDPRYKPTTNRLKLAQHSCTHFIFICHSPRAKPHDPRYIVDIPSILADFPVFSFFNALLISILAIIWLAFYVTNPPVPSLVLSQGSFLLSYWTNFLSVVSIFRTFILLTLHPPILILHVTVLLSLPLSHISLPSRTFFFLKFSTCFIYHLASVCLFATRTTLFALSLFPSF